MLGGEVVLVLAVTTVSGDLICVLQCAALCFLDALGMTPSKQWSIFLVGGICSDLM